MKFTGIEISISNHTLSPASLIKNENISTMCWCGSFESEFQLNASGLICSAKLAANQIVAGGKELALRVWDINNHGSPIFTAKNVRSSVLELSVPIWIADISVVPKSNGKLILTASRYGELDIYDLRCGQRRPVARHAWRTSRKHGKLHVGSGKHSAVLPDLTTTRPITKAVAYDNSPGIGLRVVAGNAVGELSVLDLRLPPEYSNLNSSDGPGVIPVRSYGSRAPDPPSGVRCLAGASGCITHLICSGTDEENTFPFMEAAINSEPIIVASSLDRYLRLYNRDTGKRLGKNLIAHIWISKKFRRSIEDVRTRKGAVITSNHNLVAGKIKVMLRKDWTTGKTALSSFSTSFVQNTDKLCMETLHKIQERKNNKITINNSRTKTEKVKSQIEYTEANKEIKKSIRADKQKYVKDLTTTSEKAVIAGNMKRLYDATKKLAPVNPPDTKAADTDILIAVTPTTIGKICMPIRRIKIYVKVPVTSFLVRRNASFANIENFLKKDNDTGVSNEEEKVESSYGISKTEQKEFEDLWNQIPVVDNDNDGVNEGGKRTTGLKIGKRRRKK
ncbi:unnamed protein product [Schistosoma mattheei]|uniref:Uncharacterized protein n=1 Tax=Schistosoma mattheei TaxID=31246 RepID=A0A183NWE2_9TREM|nr:unnamed protein product [Schistosoma mattheei]